MQLNTIKPADGSKKAAKRVGRGIGSGFGKTAVAVIKVRNRVLVVFIKSVLKAVRCLCSVVCLNVASFP